MRKSIKQIVFLFICLFSLILGVSGGVLLRNYKDSKSVVFRISSEKEVIDYDMLAALNFLQYQFEKLGYTVLPWRYPGAYYHQRGDNAAINVFIRGNAFFYDTRMNKNALNVYYLPRFFSMYAEEVQGYDYYISSQKNLQIALNNRFDIAYLEEGAVPHKQLKPQYKYDVLLISDELNKQYQEFTNQNYKAIYYTTLNFGKLSKKKKEELLSQARLVVYDKNLSPKNDKNYIPYAVYDIISYGRPLLTNMIFDLYQNFGSYLYYFQNTEDMINQTKLSLAEKDDIREMKSSYARKKVISDSAVVKFSLPKKI